MSYGAQTNAIFLKFKFMMRIALKNITQKTYLLDSLCIKEHFDTPFAMKWPLITKMHKINIFRRTYLADHL